jgi:hypothetical protein
MSATQIVILIVVLVVIAIIAVVAVRMGQRRTLQNRFGDEYDRLVTEKGGRAAAEAELRARQRRHAELKLRELSPEERARFRDGWTNVQSTFIEDPVAAVRAADQLVTKLVADRGYPVGSFDDRVAHLSVEHSAVLTQYREAHAISERNDAGTATTEDLRQALVHYRELVASLLGEKPVAEPDAAAIAATTAPPAGTGAGAVAGESDARLAEFDVAGEPVADRAGGDSDMAPEGTVAPDDETAREDAVARHDAAVADEDAMRRDQMVRDEMARDMTGDHSGARDDVAADDAATDEVRDDVGDEPVAPTKRSRRQTRVPDTTPPDTAA